MSPAEFSIPIHDIDAAGKPFAFPVRAEWLRAALVDSDVSGVGPDGTLDIRVSKSGTDVVVHGRVKAQLEVPCARCLAPAKVAIDQPLSVLMVPASAMKTPEEDEYEFSAEEADVVSYSGDEVVLDDVVRDEIVLEIPMIPLCSEDCPGMSPPPVVDAKSAFEDAIDPRLLPLLALKQKAEKKKE
jgi:uncharacterized protein